MLRHSRFLQLSKRTFLRQGEVYQRYVHDLETHLKDVELHVGRPASHTLKELESNARTYARNYPISIVKGKGHEVWDNDGKRYLDALQCAGALPLGHNNPTVNAALQEYLASDQITQSLDMLTPSKQAFMETLVDNLPDDFKKQAKVQFCGPSGSDSVEAAMKLAKTVTGRSQIVAFHGGYHGHTNGSLALMGNTHVKGPVVATAMNGVHFMPYPYNHRCTFNKGGEEGADLCGIYFENVLKDMESGIVKPAAVVVEVVQGEGGVIPAPHSFLQTVRRVTSELNILMIVDEIQTGFGRTGSMFAFEQAGIVPDMVTMSKALGGGMPMAALTYKAELDTWTPGAHAGTFRGNGLAMAAGKASLDYMVEHNIVDGVHAKGKLLMDRLHAMAANHPSFVGEVRGRGLMIGVEMSTAENARSVYLEAFKGGLLLQKGGRDGAVLRFLPPLNASEATLNEMADVFEHALKTADSHYKS